MLSQRVMRQSVIRRATLNSSTSASHISPSSRILLPASAFLVNRQLTQFRSLSTEKTSQDAAQSLIAEQRLRRPVAPHLAIYRPQITWYASALNRITGSILSGGLYIFGATYLVAPLFGWHVGSMSIAAAVGAWPLLAKIAMKFSLAMPFAFHCWNGIRHLVWDTGNMLKNQQVIQTGWTVVGLTVVSSLILALI